MVSRTLRIEQLDSHVLDQEIESIAHNSVDGFIRELPPRTARYLEAARPELRLAVDAALWSKRLSGASVGQELMDVAYKSYSKKLILLHFFMEKILPYISNRLAEFPRMERWERVQGKFEAVVEAISLLHFIQFLKYGGYSSVTEQFLSLKCFNNSLPMIGEANYDTQNRELMWHAFRDLLLLGYPLQKWLERKWAERKRRQMTYTKDDTLVMVCTECVKPAVIPMTGACGHVACYSCVDHSLAVCPVCAQDGVSQKMVLVCEEMKRVQ